MTPETVTSLLQYGVLGLVLALVIAGPLALGRELSRERTLTDRALENNEKLAVAIDRLADAVLKKTS